MRRALIAVGLVLLLLVAGLVVAWQAAGLAPSWYAPATDEDPAAEETAATFERRFTSELSRVRPAPEREWSVRIAEGQVNDWLATRFPAWLRHLGPTLQTRPPQVRFSRDRVMVACPMGERVVSASLRPTVEGGTLGLELDGVRLGRLPIPTVGRTRLDELGALLLGDVDDGGARAVLALLAGERIPARMELGDGRRIEVLELAVRPGELLVAFRTESPEGSPPASDAASAP